MLCMLLCVEYVGGGYCILRLTRVGLLLVVVFVIVLYWVAGVVECFWIMATFVDVASPAAAATAAPIVVLLRSLLSPLGVM